MSGSFCFRLCFLRSSALSLVLTEEFSIVLDKIVWREEDGTCDENEKANTMYMANTASLVATECTIILAKVRFREPRQLIVLDEMKRRTFCGFHHVGLTAANS